MKVTKIKYYLLLIIIIGCTNQDTNFIEIEQFNNNGSYLNIDNFKNIGFKVLKEYDVSGLENADSAFLGWMKDELNNTYDYELRFYDTHDNAINSVGIIEEIIGEDAILASRDVAWKEGNSDRRVNRRGAGSGPGSAKAKYLHYIIYGNTVILCEGLSVEESKKICTNFINQIIQ
tara:strand:- start:7596 stop:8120 length:525 start_codon:yes stop_codon:yes gene_type:complete